MRLLPWRRLSSRGNRPRRLTALSKQVELGNLHRLGVQVYAVQVAGQDFHAAGEVVHVGPHPLTPLPMFGRGGQGHMR